MLDADIFEQREAAAAGELEVEQKDVDGAVGKGQPRGGDGVGGLRGEAQAGGNLGTGIADRAIIVDDQDAELWQAVGVDAGRDRAGQVVDRCGPRLDSGLQCGVLRPRCGNLLRCRG